MIVAHDDTVVPEKTYRYYIQYRMLNPLFTSTRLATPQVAKQFAVASPGPELSTPSGSITIRSRTQVFVTAPVRLQDAHFSVFVWSPNPKETEVLAAPGDAIGPTQWTLVDIRQDPLPPKGYYVLLVDNNGNMQRRDLRKDTDDPQKKEFESRAAAAAAQAAGNPAPGQ